MAVVPMKKLSLYALKDNRKAVLELLQRRGVVEMTDAPFKDSVFEKSDVSKQLSHFDRSINTTQQALDILNRYEPEKKSMLSSLHGPETFSLEEYGRLVENHEEPLRAARLIVQLERQIAEARADILRLDSQIAALEPWLALDLSMRFKGTRSASALIGTFPRALTLEGLLTELAAAAPGVFVHAEILSAMPEQTCVFLLCLKKDEPALEAAARSIGFSYPASPSKIAPADYQKDLAARKAKLAEQIERQEEEIAAQASFRDGIRFLVDFYTMRKEKYQAIEKLSQSKHAFVLEGYAPAAAVEGLSRELAPYGAVVEAEEPSAQEDPPVLLQNSPLAEPVEGVLEMYSLPSKRDIDPTSIMAFFYYIFFGMMLSDAAYGLVMTIGCAVLLRKFQGMGAGLRKTLKMFFYCGISTMFWGVLFGSYFGDIVNVVSSTFFGREFSIPPLWFAPLDDPMKMLMFSFALGIVHLYAGLGIQFYQLWKRGDKKAALFDVGFWYGLITGLTVWLLSTDMLKTMANLTFIMPAAVVTAAQIIAGLSAVGIILTAGRDSRKPFKRLLKGAYGLYNVTGYLSDILSYSRLLALGLATGVIASVINQMGSMLGGSVAGALMLAIVFIIGHTFNIAINLLGAYVHTNRLQYVEFFGKFYEGGGRKFNPFAAHTKYYKFKEEK